MKQVIHSSSFPELMKAHQTTLVKKQCRFQLELRECHLSQGVTIESDKLSANCVNAGTVSIVRYRIDRYLKTRSYT